MNQKFGRTLIDKEENKYVYICKGPRWMINRHEKVFPSSFLKEIEARK